MSKLRGQRGFTFVELMLVIVLLAIMAGVSGMYFVNTFHSASLKNAVGKLTLMGKYARMYAIETGSDCWIHLDQEQKRFFLMAINDRSEQEYAEPIIISNPYCREASLKDGIDFEYVQINPLTESDEIEPDTERSLYFYPDGTCDAAVIQIGNGRHSLTAVFSSASTKIKIHEGPADSVDEPMRSVDLDAVD